MEASPVKPSRMSRLITRMENASARVTSRITNEPVCGTATASAMIAATTTRILISWLLIEPAQSLPNRPVGFTARIAAIGA
jgi:hypothetical protein